AVPREDVAPAACARRPGRAAHGTSSQTLPGQVEGFRSGVDADAGCCLDGDSVGTTSTCCSEDAELVTVKLKKKNGNGAYGVRLVDTEDQEAGLMIMFIPEGGALSQWIKENPSAAVAPGDSIVSVNGITAPWAIMEEMAKSSSVEMVVRPAAPGAMALLSKCHVTDRTLQTTALVLKRTIRAGDIAMDSCAICMEDVESDERVAGLQCGHGFHQRCIVRWLARHGTCGCPLCREVVH
ncbi:unnamed protein product, partial [Prorocentrum cordatum]